MSNVIPLKGARSAPKAVSSRMETLLLTANEINDWAIPPFQRPLRVNDKVRAMADELVGNGGLIPGILTLGHVGDAKKTWLVDGQHRTEAFKISELKECIADVRICSFDSMASMAEEFVNLNSSLVRMRPDDVLRGLEGAVKALKFIRSNCEFVGYDNIRRNSTGSPIVGMSQLLRSWAGALGETPGGGMAGRSAVHLAHDLDEISAERLVQFLKVARAAWGGDPEFFRLWGTLNLTMCMWMWRQLVLDNERALSRAVRLNTDQFKRCLMSVSASHDYLDWLPGRVMGDRDRNPCYTRLKAIFVARIRADSKDPTIKPKLPSPAWAS